MKEINPDSSTPSKHIYWKIGQDGGLDSSVVQDSQGIADGYLNMISRLIPQGAYTTIRTYDHSKVLDFNSHIKRLETSAKLAGYEVHFDESIIRNQLRQIIAKSQEVDLRIRLTATFPQEIGCLYVAYEKLSTPTPEEFFQGVRVTTLPLQREKPQAKLTGFIEKAGKTKKSLKSSYNECLMVGEDGVILEGLSSNFFALCDGKIFTEDVRVLPGITRKMVLQILHEMEIPVVMFGINKSMLSEVQEAFITSTSRSILPVVRIDNFTIGNGKPGQLTRNVIQKFQKLVDENLEEI